jgi:hypothetical protein
MKSLNILIIVIATSIFIVGCNEELPVSSSDNTNITTSLQGSLYKSADQSRGSALFFDGNGDYVLVEDSPSLDMTDGFTIAAWIYLETYTEWASVVTKGMDANNYTIHQSGPVGGNDFGHLRFTGSSPALPVFPFLESDTQIPLNEWHHIALTYDGENLIFYLDGVADGGGALEGPLEANDEALHIAADFPGGDEFWNGAIDELKIWNEALKAKHIRTAMNGHSSPVASGLAGLWRFDEGAGNTVDDRSPNRNNGTLIGDTAWITP